MTHTPGTTKLTFHFVICQCSPGPLPCDNQAELVTLTPTFDVVTRTPLSMTAHTSFEELESSVPLAQLLPSVAFAQCAAHLPHEVDSLHGDELVRSLENALAIHSKARVVLQCWVLLILRRRAGLRHERDALYDRLQLAPVNPQEKMRYRRGAMLLCHLLIERDAVESGSLLDRYLVDYYFSWSSAVNERDDAFYLEGDSVVPWVRQALDHLDQNGSKMTATRWLELSRPTSTSTSTTTSSAAVLPDPSSPTPPRAPLDSLDTLLSASVSVEQAPPQVAQRTRSRGSDHISATPPVSSTVLVRTPSPSSSSTTAHRKQKRRRADAFSEHTEINSLREAVERWARRLRRQLLAAARANDQKKIRRVADQLRAPPLLRKAVKHTREPCAADKDITSEDDEDNEDEQQTTDTTRVDHQSASTSPATLTDSDSSSRNNTLNEQHECTVCAEEPARMEQVWNTSCGHGFCGVCMHARLSQRARRCMGCRKNITQVADSNGRVFQHYEWTRWWKQSQGLLS